MHMVALEVLLAPLARYPTGRRRRQIGILGRQAWRRNGRVRVARAGQVLIFLLRATTPRVAAVLAVTAVVLCLAEGLRSAAFLRRVTQELILMRHKVSGVSAFTAAALVLLLLRVMDLPVVTVVLALTLAPPALEAVTEVMVAAEG